MSLAGLSFVGTIAFQTLVEILAELIIGGLKALVRLLFGSHHQSDNDAERSVG